LTALPMFRLQPAGFTNADLRTITADLRGIPSDRVTAGQMTYDLRRLKTHGLIVKIEHTHRYRVTDNGLHTAAFLSRIHDRLLPTGLAELTDPHANRPLRVASIAYQKAIDNIANATGLAA
jgi:DNA-binding PadR family transcriptional regulator